MTYPGLPLRLVSLALLAVTCLSCVKPFDGSQIEMTLDDTTDMPGDGVPGAPPAGAHYMMFAEVNVSSKMAGAIVPIQAFTVQPVLDLNDNCEIAYTASDCRGLGTDNNCGNAKCVPGALIRDVMCAADLARNQGSLCATPTPLCGLHDMVRAVIPYTTLTEPTGIPTDESAASQTQRLHTCATFLYGPGEDPQHPTATVPATAYPPGVLVKDVYYLGSFRTLATPITGQQLGIIDTGSNLQTNTTYMPTPPLTAMCGGMATTITMCKVAAPTEVLGGIAITTPYNLDGLDHLFINWSTVTDPTKIDTDIGTAYVDGVATRQSTGLYSESLADPRGTVHTTGQAAIYVNLGTDYRSF